MADSGFVGRTNERQILESVMGDARMGLPQVVLVTGPAGIGKTALVRRALDECPGTDVVWVSGYETETLYGFGVIEQIGRALGGEGLGSQGVSRDHLVIGAELLESLAERASRGPLALVVDDAPWADDPSLSALGFALRRLVAERIVTIFAGRDEDVARLAAGPQRWLFGESGHTRVALRGLDEQELVALADSVGRPALSSYAARRLRNHTGGNPLHARALLVDLDPGVLAEPSLAPLPAPGSFATLVLGRLARLDGSTQEFVAAGAVLGTYFPVAEAGALAGSSEPAGALDGAVRAGLLEAAPTPGGDVRFAHPLVQAAVYHDLAPGRRAALHLSAAELASSTAAALRHRAAACLGPEPEVAADLARFASEQAERGSWAQAADAFLSASRLSPGGPNEGWLLSGVECLVLAGNAPAAISMRDSVEGCRAGPMRDYVLGLIAWMCGDLAGGHRLYQRAWSVDTGTEPTLRAKIASQLAMVAVNEGRGGDAVDWATKSLTANPEAPDRAIAHVVRAMGFGETGRFAEGIAETGDLDVGADDLGAGRLGALVGRGVLHMWAGHPAAAVSDLSRAEEAARHTGPLHLRIIALYYLAEAEYRLGRWLEALVHAELAASLGTDAGGMRTLGLAHTTAVFPAAGRGEWERAEGHIKAASQVVALLGDPANRLWLSMARARLSQARGDHEGVLAATDDTLALGVVDGREQPGIQPWALLRAEALARRGRAPEASRLLAETEERVVSQEDNLNVRMDASRIRGLLAANERNYAQAEAAFEQAEALAADYQVRSLETALIHLDYGAFLRRRGRRRAAGEQLREAQEILSAMGAAPFLQRCDTELAACGLASGQHDQSPLSPLTPQEQAVATLVATGLSNRQVAERLVISTKGVGYHLGNIFAKLGIRTRTELAVRIAHPGAAPEVGSQG